MFHSSPTKVSCAKLKLHVLICMQCYVDCQGIIKRPYLPLCAFTGSLVSFRISPAPFMDQAQVMEGVEGFRWREVDKSKR